MTRDETLIAAFADELRFRRAALRLSQEELAHRAGINRTYIAKLELARNQPTLTVLFRIAEALDVSLPELMAGAIARRYLFPSWFRLSAARLLDGFDGCVVWL